LVKEIQRNLVFKIPGYPGMPKGCLNVVSVIWLEFTEAGEEI